MKRILIETAWGTGIKKAAVWSAVALMSFALTGCGKCEHEFDNGVITKESTCTEEGEKTFTCTLCEETKVESVPLKSHTYEEEVTKKPTFEEEGEKTFVCESCGESYTEPIPVRDDEVEVSVTDKSNLPADVDAGRYSDTVELTFEVKNRTDKTIRGVQGNLTVYDMFGEKILAMRCDFTGNNIPVDDFITVDDMGLEVNQFMDEHIKLYDTDYPDLQFDYEVTNIVYDDGSSTIEQSSTELKESQKVTVVVKDKESLDIDYDEGRYSPRIDFVFEVFNNTSKGIKGVQGILTTKDLFGVDIMSSSLDFTGKEIPANESVIFDNLGFDVNQFMDEHVKVYTTDYSDLQFEYEVTSIVYSDGTTE
ncbi:MAG: hypothetical protein K2O13_00185 [Lachnospiraceae bacterium]|nr:hypothetical protein [Lachnospiraceae bacterium]